MDAPAGVQALKSLQHLMCDATDLRLRQTMIEFWRGEIASERKESTEKKKDKK